MQNSSHSVESTWHYPIKGAALIATFYGKVNQMHSLKELFIRSFTLDPLQNNDYINEEKQIFLRCFEPHASSAHDTTVVQLVLNAARNDRDAWDGMRGKLEGTLTNDDLLCGTWGYTLVYQGETLPDVSFATLRTVGALAAKRLHPAVAEMPQILAQTDLSGGQIYLVDIPLQGDALKAAMVYMAFSQPGTENRLIRDILFNPVSPWLMIDLIAHKGYHQMRQYRLGHLDQQYRQKVDHLLERTDGLLKNLTSFKVRTDVLDEMAKEYGLLVSATSHLHELHISLQRQEFNLNWWSKQLDLGEVSTFHHYQLNDAAYELELLITGAQLPLEAARTVTEMIRVRIDKGQESKQQRVETLLASAAVVLSTLVLIDKDVARAILAAWGMAEPIGIVPVLGIQVACIVIFALLTMLIIKLLRTWSSR